MASWRKLTVHLGEQHSVAAQELLLKEGALGLIIEDDETRAVPEKPFTATGQATITAMFEPKNGLEAAISSRFAQFEKCEMEWVDFAEEDWVDRFQKEWTTFTIGEGIWIVPSWERASFRAPQKDAVVLFMDPGMAFGTGHHETTALCARAIARSVAQATSPLRLLDVGTGTGILAFVALKMGIQEAVGIDIDPEACRVAKENAADNGVSERFHVFESLPKKMPLDFDVVVANILAQPLIDLAKEIARPLKVGGKLFLSGVLKSQEASVKKAYEEQALQYIGSEYENDWVRLDFQR